MITLINQIDACLSSVDGKRYGLCELVKDDKGEHYPRTVGREAIKVTPNDKYKILTYHRLLDGDFSENDTFSFGRSRDRLNTQRVRMVVVAEIQLDAKESVIDKIIEQLPDKISNDSYRYSQVGESVTLIRDKENIWESEWGNAYKDKYQMRYNIYALEYSIDYIKCEELCQ